MPVSPIFGRKTDGISCLPKCVVLMGEMLKINSKFGKNIKPGKNY